MQTTTIYQANAQATQKYIINQGGTGSGKTYSILQHLFILAIQHPNNIITIVGQDIPNLKKGAFRDATTIYHTTPQLTPWFAPPNKTDRTFECRNGSILEFTSFADEQDARSGKRDYLFVNEANGISYPIFWQLAIRTRKQVFVDYNPTCRFWAHDQLIGKPNTQLIISDHRHNPFLSQEMHQEIESIEDPELFNVYARGKTGKLEGLIYNNWQLTQEMPQTYKARYIGLDFGFTNDPTAIIDIRLAEGELWIDELCYQRRMLNSHIFSELQQNNLLQTLVIADSAEPKSIAELQHKGAKIEPAIKGADSIKSGIDILKRYKLNITQRSTNLRKELLSYMWKKDPETAQLTNQPIDSFNHALDAIRYVALNKLSQKRNPKPPKVSTTSY